MCIAEGNRPNAGMTQRACSMGRPRHRGILFVVAMVTIIQGFALCVISVLDDVIALPTDPLKLIGYMYLSMGLGFLVLSKFLRPRFEMSPYSFPDERTNTFTDETVPCVPTKTSADDNGTELRNRKAKSGISADKSVAGTETDDKLNRVDDHNEIKDKDTINLESEKLVVDDLLKKNETKDGTNTVE